jgi:hypothetical protein
MRYAMLAVFVLMFQACARNAPLHVSASARPAPAVPAIAGTWQLVAVAGEDIPVAPMHGGTRMPVEITASTFSIPADGTFTMTMTYRNPSSGDSFSRRFEGTYVSEEGTAFRFDWKNAGATRVWLENGRLIMDNEGSLFAYTR